MTDYSMSVLNERTRTHGKWEENARITQSIMRILQTGQRWPDMEDQMLEAMHLIAHKMHRIVNGDPNFEDHWRDMAGYATLVADTLLSRQEAAPVPVEDSNRHAERETIFRIHQTSYDKLPEEAKALYTLLSRVSGTYRISDTIDARTLAALDPTWRSLYRAVPITEGGPSLVFGMLNRKLLQQREIDELPRHPIELNNTEYHDLAGYWPGLYTWVNDKWVMQEQFQREWGMSP